MVDYFDDLNLQPKPGPEFVKVGYEINEKSVKIELGVLRGCSGPSIVSRILEVILSFSAQSQKLEKNKVFPTTAE